jgi:hypothetical protein
MSQQKVTRIFSIETTSDEAYKKLASRLRNRLCTSISRMQDNGSEVIQLREVKIIDARQVLYYYATDTETAAKKRNELLNQQATGTICIVQNWLMGLRATSDYDTSLKVHHADITVFLPTPGQYTGYDHVDLSFSNMVVQTTAQSYTRFHDGSSWSSSHTAVCDYDRGGRCDIEGDTFLIGDGLEGGELTGLNYENALQAMIKKI